MDVPGLGRVTKDKRFGWHVSKPLRIPFLRGHKCRFALEGYDEDEQQADFHKAIKNALNADETILSRAHRHVLRYCRDMLAMSASYGWPAPQLDHLDNIWKHVHFGDTIHVSRRYEGDDEDGIYLSLECNCDWEVEHGLQLVLRNGRRITKVGPFDGHVTNSDAAGDSSLEGVVYRSS